MERAAGIVLFREKIIDKKKIREYLILKYSTADKYWGFSKGHIEPGETEEQAALREAEEETGLKKIGLIKGFEEKTRYYFTHNGKFLSKEVTWFFGKVSDNRDGLVSHEHEELRWLSFEEALRLLSFEEYKKLLSKAEQKLSFN